jgi:hypothetical protein
MSSLQYFNLAISAPKRLAMMRADFATHAERYPNCPEQFKPDSWRKVRGYGLHNYDAAFSTCHVGPDALYSFDQRSIPVRSIIDAHEVEGVRMNHTGYYADSNQDQGSIVPIVARLSHGRFLSGYRWDETGEYTVFTSTVFDDESEAARDADHEADKRAEEMRDDNDRFNAMNDAEQLVEDKESDLRDAWADYKTAQIAYLQDPKRFAGQVIKAREWVSELIVDLRAFRREFDDAKQAYERG